MKTDIKEMKNTIMEKTKDGNKKWKKKKQHYKKSRKRIWKKDQNNRQKESETKLCIVIKKEQWKQEKNSESDKHGKRWRSRYRQKQINR